MAHHQEVHTPNRKLIPSLLVLFLTSIVPGVVVASHVLHNSERTNLATPSTNGGTYMVISLLYSLFAVGLSVVIAAGLYALFSPPVFVAVAYIGANIVGAVLLFLSTVGIVNRANR